MNIIIGRGGQQWFPIRGRNVSEEHAEIEIDEETGVWMLRDLNSTNGTFVREEETGEFRRVSCVRINPLTFVCLGSDNDKGCCFYARQIEHPGNFNEEIRYLKKKDSEFAKKISKAKKNTTIISNVSWVLTLLVIGFSLVFSANEGNLNVGSLRYLLVLAVPPLTKLLTHVFDTRKKIEARRELFSHCPNPECNYKLRHQDIENAECPHCHKI
ncbi:MAG: FHA domain-containing protein [Prevotella sp.]|nr:FHA domain-containing protein [Prevotella sp.]